MPLGRPFFDKQSESRNKWTGRERELNPRFAGGANAEYGTDKELHSLFLRVRREVDFQGAFTPSEIDARLRDTAKGLRILARRGYEKPEKAERRAKNLEKLEGTNFGPTVIAAARRHPYGVENLTLNYGRKAAMDIILERDRKLMEMMRTRRERD
jgi:hypothetical protein